MPREIRKRGRKHKKLQQKTVPDGLGQYCDDAYSKNAGEPSWIVPARETKDAHPEAPFGYVDPEIKAYFRTIDEQIRSWQEDGPPLGRDVDGHDEDEEKRVFFVAALGEISGKERQLATDPDCSVVLERMAYSMDDFVLRVLMDRLSGSFEVLFKHRFASHVCQTLLSVATDTVSREENGRLPDVPASEEDGELRTLTQLVLDICEEIAPSFNSLTMDPFASHVLRSLLLLLCPNVLPENAVQKSVRSKKSISWKAKQGHMRSVFSDVRGKEAHSPTVSVPGTFRGAADQFLRLLRDGLDANEVRALAVHKVAGPVLQLVLEIEADHGSTASSDSLMDRVLVGMIRAYNEGSLASVQLSDYLVVLLRDPTSSHLLETLVLRCPGRIFDLLWSMYFEGSLVRLALHPVANFVLARAIERQDNKQLGNTLNELKLAWTKLIKSSRTGVLRAVIDRSWALGAHQEDVCEAVLAAVEICNPDDRINLVLCVLSLKSFKEYHAISAAGERPEVHRKKGSIQCEIDDQREPKVQGALILQSLLRLDEPCCSIIIDSINSLSIEELIRIAQNAIGSRVLDALFESPTVSFKAKRRFVMSLIGHYHSLVDDRIGSRIADRCWAFADPYLREKIARSLIPHEQSLTASFYGKFFARGLNLYLLQRRPEDWRIYQSDNKANSKRDQQGSHPRSTSLLVPVAPTEPSDRQGTFEDEIDVVFKATLGNKIKKAAVGQASVPEGPVSADRQLSEVLSAIREAPSGESLRRKKRRKIGRDPRS